MNLDAKLDRVVARRDELNSLVAAHADPSSSDYAAMTRELVEMAPLVAEIEQLKGLRQERTDVEAMLADPAADGEMRGMAEEEAASLDDRIGALEQQIRVMLLPKDEADDRNVILEVRAGTGGDEAALFAAELFRMYQRYAELRGWRFEVLNFSDTGIGGCKEASAAVSGRGV